MQALSRSRLTFASVLGAACGCASTSSPRPPSDYEPTIHRPVADASHPANPPVESMVERASFPSLREQEALAEDEWHASLAPDLWTLSIAGYSTAKGTRAEMDLGFDDPIDHADLAARARIDVWQVDILGDGTCMDFGTKTELDSSPPPGVDGDKNWIDRMVGVRMTKDRSNAWVPSLRADIGGLASGDSSDLAREPIGLFGWGFGTNERIWIGYRYMDVDYDDSRWNDKFDFDTVMQGSVVGVAFGF